MGWGEEEEEEEGEEASNAHFQLAQSVLTIVAGALQSAVTICAVVQRGVAETVLCKPPGAVTLPVRFSKALLGVSGGEVGSGARVLGLRFKVLLRGSGVSVVVG